MKMDKQELEAFLNCDLDKIRVVEISDGEITLEIDETDKAFTLYLNHKLNEAQGFPKSFIIKRHPHPYEG